MRIRPNFWEENEKKTLGGRPNSWEEEPLQLHVENKALQLWEEEKKGSGSGYLKIRRYNFGRFFSSVELRFRKKSGGLFCG